MKIRRGLLESGGAFEWLSPSRWTIGNLTSAVSVVRKSRLLSESLWVIAGQIIVALVGLIGIRVLTELAPKAVFGEATLLTGLIVLGRDIFISPIVNSQIRFHPEYLSKGRIRWFTDRINGLAQWAGIVCGLTISVVYIIWRILERNDWRPFLILALLLFLVTDTSKNLRINRLNAERLQRLSSTWNSFESITMVFFSALFLWYWTSTEGYLFGQIAGGALGVLIFGMVCYPPLKADTGSGENESASELSRRVIRYGLPFIPLAILTWVYMLGDRYIIAMRMGAADVGQYAAVFAVGSRPFLMLSAACTTVFRPVLFDAASRNDTDKARDTLRFWILTVCCISIIGIVCFWRLGIPLCSILLARQYRDGAPELFLWVACGFGLYTLTQALENGLLSREHSHRIIMPQVLGTAVSLIFTVILVSRSGVLGATQAKVLGFGIQSIATLWTFAAGSRRTRFEKLALKDNS